MASGRLYARKSVSGSGTQDAKRQHDDARQRLRHRASLVALSSMMPRTAFSSSAIASAEAGRPPDSSPARAG